MSYAAQLRAYGADEDQIYTTLLRVNKERCKPPLCSYQELKDLRRMAQWAGKKAKATRERAITEAEAHCLVHAEHAVETHPWKGIAARNVKSVALALIAKMRGDRIADDCVGDARSLADDLGLSRSVVQRSLRKLSGVQKDHRILVLFSRQATCTVKRFEDGRDPVQYAYSYSIRQNLKRCKNEPPCLLWESADKSTWLKFAPSPLHDAFRVRGKGLTKSAALVLDTLPARTRQEVQRKLCLSLRTVKTAFASLVAERLIEKKNHFWVRTSESLDTVAVRRGTVGAAQRQHAQHAHERSTYRARLREKPGSKLKLVQKFGGKVSESEKRRFSIPEADYSAFPETIFEFSVPPRASRTVAYAPS
jgi:hypothetical protein